MQFYSMDNILKEFDVMIYCGSSSWGGMEIMALENVKQLIKQGFKICITCVKDSPLHIHSISTSIKIFFLLEGTGKLHNYRKFASIIKNYDIKVIHTHFSNDLWVIVPAIKKMKTRLFLTKHLASGVIKKDALHKYLYKRVTKIFAISNFIKKNVLETCPIPEEKVILMPNGIDVNKFSKEKFSRDEIRNELNIQVDKIVTGLVGRITPGKGHKEFIEAIETVNKTHSAGSVFLIIGSSSKGEERFEEEIKKLAKEKNINNIIFTGYRNDISRIFAGMDILAFPSHEESFGITLLEAMAMEVPVIASNNAGIIDIIPTEEFGLLIPPKISNALADAIIKLSEDKDLRKKLSSNARKRVEEKFNIESITKEMVKHYKLSEAEQN